MRIIFVKDHIIDDLYGIKIKAGKTGMLLDDVTGTVEIQADGIPDIQPRDKLLVYGIIEGVQPDAYIPRRDDL